jgi:aminoacylase
MERLELHPGHPMYLLTWAGADAALKSLVLLSHMDVVPAETDKWTVDPWAAIEATGPDGRSRIFGRGAQDMCSVSIQQLEALARLKAEGFVPPRTIHVLLVPDEELGGGRGIRLLLAHEKMRALSPAIVLDEGLASPDAAMHVFYGERKVWWVRLVAEGPAGHGSRFVKGTAVAKLVRVLDAILDFRAEQEAALEAGHGCGKTLGDVTSVNCTMLAAGEPDATKPQ